MRVLLDTHAFLWFVLNNPRLSLGAKATIEDPANDVLLSPATHWEIAIKISTGKLVLGQPFQHFIESQIALNRFLSPSNRGIRRS